MSLLVIPLPRDWRIMNRVTFLKPGRYSSLIRLICSASLAVPAIATAQTVYRWTDASGHAVFSQSRPATQTTGLRSFELPAKRTPVPAPVLANTMQTRGTATANSDSISISEESRAVRLTLTDEGFFSTRGRINGKPAVCVIDTGASLVAINLATAMRLGVNPGRGPRVRVTTASGVVGARRIQLDSIEIGAIKVDRVDAVVLDGVQPENVLLGMSYLKGVDLTQRGNEITLSAKK